MLNREGIFKSLTFFLVTIIYLSSIRDSYVWMYATRVYKIMKIENYCEEKIINTTNFYFINLDLCIKKRIEKSQSYRETLT